MALIAAGEWGEAPAPVVAGRSLVLRQFDFARAWGVERVIAYRTEEDHGGEVGACPGGDAEELRLAADRAGIAHTAITSACALVALVDWADELLVLQPGLLPESGAAIALLGDGGKVLGFQAERVPQQGLERIDADTFWAGALVIPGTLVDRLDQLAEDADPHAALLRIALQARLPIEPLAPELLIDRRWALVRSEAEATKLGAERMRRVAASGPLTPPSRRLAEVVLGRLAPKLNKRRIAPAASLAASVLALCGSVIAAWLGWPASAFAAIALAVPVLHGARLLERLGRAAFERPRIGRWLAHLPDVALLMVGVLSLDGPWYRQLFVPLVLLIALRRIAPSAAWHVLAGDRMVGTMTLACAAAIGLHEPAMMTWALLALVAGRPSLEQRAAPRTSLTVHQ